MEWVIYKSTTYESYYLGVPHTKQGSALPDHSDPLLPLFTVKSKEMLMKHCSLVWCITPNKRKIYKMTLSLSCIVTLLKWGGERKEQFFHHMQSIN